jgi:hypothetical protein
MHNDRPDDDDVEDDDDRGPERVGTENANCSRAFSATSATAVIRAHMAPRSRKNATAHCRTPRTTWIQPQAVMSKTRMPLLVVTNTSSLKIAANPSMMLKPPTMNIMIAAKAIQPTHRVALLGASGVC